MSGSPPNSPPPKIAIATLGTRGDVQPYASLAQALVQQGADVVLASSEGFEDMIRSVGARPFSLPINYQDQLSKAETQEALFSLRGKISAARSTFHLQKNVVRQLHDHLLEETPDLILFNLKAATATLAARLLNVPAVPTCLQPILTPTAHYPISIFDIPNLGAFFNKTSWWSFRQLFNLGMRPLVRSLRGTTASSTQSTGSLLDGHMPDGQKAPSLQAYSAALVPSPSDWPPTAHQTGYWFSGPTTDFTPPAELNAFLRNGPPPIYIGFGSMPSRDAKALTRMLADALLQTDDRAILSTGWGGLSARDLPVDLHSRVHVLEKAPHSWLFPKCSAIIHHGGSGTTHEALRWGKPSLILPVFGDQPFWGRRVYELGAGPPPIAQKHLTSETLALKLSELKCSNYQHSAEAIANLMRQEMGAAGTASFLLQTFFERPPSNPPN